MPWLQLRIPATGEHAEPLAAAFEACGALAVSISGREDEHVLQSATEPARYWRACRVTGLFPGSAEIEAILGCLRDALGLPQTPAHEFAQLADEDWATSWMNRFRPIEITPELWICPSWIEPPRPEAINILIDPGLAFGTGEHPTTALCLRWLAEQDLRGKTVIDYGCGSGILSIAALKLGARSVIGVDIDPQALRVTRENLARNGLKAGFRGVAPGGLPADTHADIVVANILANPLMELAPRICASLSPRGHLALSGLLVEQQSEVQAVYEPQVHFSPARRRGEWLLLCGTRRG